MCEGKDDADDVAVFKKLNDDCTVPLSTALTDPRPPVPDTLLVVEGVFRMLAVSIFLLDALAIALALFLLERVAEAEEVGAGDVVVFAVVEMEGLGRTEFEDDNECRDEIDEETD